MSPVQSLTELGGMPEAYSYGFDWGCAAGLELSEPGGVDSKLSPNSW